MDRIIAWIREHKKIVAAIGAAVAAGATALGYACPEPLQRAWAAIMGVL